jgi:ribonuclease BN (tRNA processing enzyme)
MVQRYLSWAIGFCALLAAQATPASSGQAETSLTLLGTAGGPGGHVERAGIASLVKVNGRSYLIDAGEGVARQLALAGASERDVAGVFLTHLHDDHTAGLPSLISFAYTQSGGQVRKVQVIGPPRTKALVEGLLSYLNVNREIRTVEQPRLKAPPASYVEAREVEPGVVYSDENLRVTAAENTHFHIAANSTAVRNRSYAYRFETPGRVIVFTGDTGPSEKVAELARGADILVAEMISEKDIASIPPPILEHLLTEHLTATEVGKLAAAAKVKTLVLSHIRDVGEKDVAEIRRHFTGKILVGRDLQKL